MSTYSDKLKDIKWQSLRVEALERDEFKCQCCSNEDEKKIHVHHKFYTFGLEPWDYPIQSLITLCSDCHETHDEFREMVFKNLPKNKHELAKKYLLSNNNRELWNYCNSKFPKSETQTIGEVFKEILDELKHPELYLNKKTRWDYVNF